MEPEREPYCDRRAALVEAMLSNSPDTRRAQLETHVGAMSEEALLVLEEIVRTGKMDLVDLAKHPRVAYVLPPVWYRANKARQTMIKGDLENLMRLSRLSGPPTEALMDAMAELVPEEEEIIRMWTWQNPKKWLFGVWVCLRPVRGHHAAWRAAGRRVRCRRRCGSVSAEGR